MSRSSKWSSKDLEAALRDVQDRKVPVRMVAAAHGIPKSTLYDYASARWNLAVNVAPIQFLQQQRSRNW